MSILRTLLQLRPRTIRKEVRTLPVQDYDLIITDFEPISARAAHKRKIPCVHVSNQAAFISPKVPRPPKKNPIVEILFSKRYIPAQKYIGFRFKKYEPWIHAPIISSALRSAHISDNGSFVVYLNMYPVDHLISIFSQLPEHKFLIFSPDITHTKERENITLMPVDKDSFTEALTASHGVITTAGFQTPAEALFLGKKLLAVPLQAHYEQECNAAALKQLGVMTVDKVDHTFAEHFKKWTNEYEAIQLDYPDETETIVKEILHEANKPMH